MEPKDPVMPKAPSRLSLSGARLLMPGEAARYRWSVAARTLAGTLGAYGVTALATVALSLILAAFGMNRAEAVTAATLGSYALFAVVAMTVFHAKSALRAWLGLTAAALPLMLLARLLMPAA